jgi:hypothetical protein
MQLSPCAAVRVDHSTFSVNREGRATSRGTSMLTHRPLAHGSESSRLAPRERGHADNETTTRRALGGVVQPKFR